eukprot:2871960-Amphidinium_carterae.1
MALSPPQHRHVCTTHTNAARGQGVSHLWQIGPPGGKKGLLLGTPAHTRTHLRVDAVSTVLPTTLS